MKQRILTGLIAGSGLMALLYVGGFWFAALIVLLAWIGLNEFLRMNNLHTSIGLSAIGYIAVLLLVLPWTQIGISFFDFTGRNIWLVMFVLLAVTVGTKNKITIDQIANVLLGVIYVGFGFRYMIETRWMESGGLFWTLLVFGCIWASDSGAYFTGTWIGRTPLWPAISPKKSVEGALGGVVLSVAISCLFAWFKPELLGWSHAIVLGIVIAVIGQLGDLMQSAYKRVKGIKDSGTLLPGHGGVLDRTDSWLIVFPFLHLLALLPV